ncbi:MAG: hybrid sensor histidine kinase/response regulator [Marinifilaceae bacterium]|nr:hybrid sensor histidine kinase/response regulator [Marinifilaceae bacterium]
MHTTTDNLEYINLCVERENFKSPEEYLHAFAERLANTSVIKSFGIYSKKTTNKICGNLELNHKLIINDKKYSNNHFYACKVNDNVLNLIKLKFEFDNLFYFGDKNYFIFIRLVKTTESLYINLIGECKHFLCTLNNYKKSSENKITNSKIDKNIIKEYHLKSCNQKLDKSNILNNINHELKTPLNSIINFAKLIQDIKTSKRQSERFANKIRTNSENLLNIFDKIINSSQLIFDNKEFNNIRFNIKDPIIELYNKYYADFIRKQIDFRHNITSKQESVYADYKGFNTIFSNLIENALKFTQSGCVEIGCMEINNEQVFYVKDSGIGIETKSQEFIFDAFTQNNSTTNREFNGMGLGLFESKLIIEQQNGKIWLDSEPDYGSVFYFSYSNKTLPTDQINFINCTPEPKIDIQSQNINEFENKSILIVEDVKSNYDYLYSIIEMTETKVLWAQNGLEAIDIVTSENPDLILMDIRMPKMDGLEAIDLIKKIRPNTPIVVQTAYLINKEDDICLKKGVKEFLIKPIEPETIYKLLEDYLCHE